MLGIIPYPQKVTVVEGNVNRLKTIQKKIKKTGLGKEGYKVIVNNNETIIEAEDQRGLFYGEKTLEQLKENLPLPCMVIEDSPKYKHRGYMLDCCRHFFTVDEIKKQIDMMAQMKLNIFHWHLTEDQGWRIEIDKYPLLTEVGSKRKQTAGDNIPIEGYYTKEQIKEIVEYCKERCIEVIPEIDMPGHFTAAIAAYPFLSCTEKKIKVAEGYGIFPNIACAGKETTYKFCYDVLDEIIELFPYDYIHLGGDEALKLNWIDCPHCQKAIKENNLKNEEQLQGYFMSQMVKYLNKKGKKAINWNDGMLADNIEGGISVQYWKQSKECNEVVKTQSQKGREIIISPFFSYYLDYPHGMTPLKKTYNYQIDTEIEDKAIGLEAPLWTEHVADIKRVEVMTYPRLLAVAERAWTKNADYGGFLQRLKLFEKLFEKHNINYCQDYNPNIIKGKLNVARFFINALKKVGKGNIRAMKLTKKKLKKKYNN